MYSNGFKYWLAYKKGTAGYYRCRRYKHNCPGRCIVDEEGVLRVTTAHDHPPEEDRVIVDRFRKVLTQRATTERTDLHVIYLEEATNRHSDASLLYPFSQAESCMRKARRKQHPQEPSDMEELRETLENSELFRIHTGSHWDEFVQIMINRDSVDCILLWHQRTIEALGSIEELYIGCCCVQSDTKKPLKYHLLVGLAVQQQNCTPIFYSIMTAKEYVGFIAILEVVRERLGSFISPSRILTEPDSLIQGALEQIFPEVTIKIYWHHYTVAVLDRMRCLGLGRETAKGLASSGLKMLLVVPLLPASYISPGLEDLKKWMQERNVFSESFCQLCSYVEHTWIGGLGAKKLSMFGQTHHISSQVEHFLKDISHQEWLSSNSIWQMLDSLTQLATKQYMKVSRKNKPSAYRYIKPLNKFQQVQETVLHNATQLWIKTAVHLRNPLQFIQLCSHCINDAMIMESNPLPNNGISSPIKFKVVYSAQSAGSANSAATAENTTDQESVPTVLPTSEPPPLSFFPRIAPERHQATNLHQPPKPQVVSQSEPPPLVPFANGEKSTIDS